MTPDVTTLLQQLGGAGRLRDAATGILLFVGAIATVAGLADQAALLSDSLLYVGAGGLVVLFGTAGAGVLNELRRADDTTAGGPDTADGLVLYQAEGCPHCARVRQFCTEQSLSLTLHNPRTAGTPFTGGTVTNHDRHTELTGHGQDQIPLLVDTERGESLYESGDIVAYLDEHYA
jgi:hypothetical protein